MSSKSILLLTAAMIFAASQLSAGEATKSVRLRYANSIPEMNIGGMTMPARVDTMTYWVTTGASRVDMVNGTSTIYNAKTGHCYRLYTKFKFYQDMNPGGAASDSFNLFREGLQEMRPQLKSQLTPTDSFKVIKGYRCRMYLMDSRAPELMMTQSSEIWATEDIKVDTTVWHGIFTRGVSSDNGFAKWGKEFDKIDGVIVLQVSKVAVNSEAIKLPSSTSTFELIDVAEQQAPVGYYELPNDYEVKPGE